jgi:hypothetical protein
VKLLIDQPGLPDGMVITVKPERLWKFAGVVVCYAIEPRVDSTIAVHIAEHDDRTIWP